MTIDPKALAETTEKKNLWNRIHPAHKEALKAAARAVNKAEASQSAAREDKIATAKETLLRVVFDAVGLQTNHAGDPRLHADAADPAFFTKHYGLLKTFAAYTRAATPEGVPNRAFPDVVATLKQIDMLCDVAREQARTASNGRG